MTEQKHSPVTPDTIEIMELAYCHEITRYVDGKRVATSTEMRQAGMRAALQALHDNVSRRMKDLGQDMIEDDYKEHFSGAIFQAMLTEAMRRPE